MELISYSVHHLKIRTSADWRLRNEESVIAVTPVTVTYSRIPNLITKCRLFNDNIFLFGSLGETARPFKKTSVISLLFVCLEMMSLDLRLRSNYSRTREPVIRSPCFVASLMRTGVECCDCSLWLRCGLCGARHRQISPTAQGSSLCGSPTAGDGEWRLRVFMYADFHTHVTPHQTKPCNKQHVIWSYRWEFHCSISFWYMLSFWKRRRHYIGAISEMHVIIH